MVNDAARAEVQRMVVPVPYGAGFASKVTEHVGAPQLEFGGVVAEHTPLQLYVPVLLSPQAFAEEVHDCP